MKVRVYDYTGLRSKEVGVWWWRVVAWPFVVSGAITAFLFYLTTFVFSWRSPFPTGLLTIASAFATVWFFFSMILAGEGQPSLTNWQIKWLNRKGWVAKDPYYGESTPAQIINMLDSIRDATKEFSDIETLRTLSVNAEACAHSYTKLTSQYEYFRDIDTPNASMSRETILHDRDKVMAALRDVYTAAHSLVNKERAAIAEDKAKALEMSTSPYAGDVSDLVTRATDEARLAREYINNR